MSIEMVMIWVAEAVVMVEGNMYVIAMVRWHTGPRCRRTHGRMYTLCRDLGECATKYTEVSQ